jgi:hypothetical protein
MKPVRRFHDIPSLRSTHRPSSSKDNDMSNLKKGHGGEDRDQPTGARADRKPLKPAEQPRKFPPNAISNLNNNETRKRSDVGPQSLMPGKEHAPTPADQSVRIKSSPPGLPLSSSSRRRTREQIRIDNEVSTLLANTEVTAVVPEGGTNRAESQQELQRPTQPMRPEVVQPDSKAVDFLKPVSLPRTPKRRTTSGLRLPGWSLSNALTQGLNSQSEEDCGIVRSPTKRAKLDRSL